MMHRDARARRRRAGVFADMTELLLGIPAEELCRIGDLPARVRKRLAVLEGDQLGEAFRVRDDNLIGLAQNLGALARLASAPPFERLLRGIDSGLGILDAGARHRDRKST